MNELRVVFHTERYDESVRFYGETLGLSVRDSWDGPDARGTIFRLSGGMVEVTEATPGAPEPPPSGVYLAAEVDDVAACHARMVAAGVAITQPLAVQPWGHHSFGIEDPSGIPLVFFEVLPDAH